QRDLPFALALLDQRALRLFIGLDADRKPVADADETRGLREAARELCVVDGHRREAFLAEPRFERGGFVLALAEPGRSTGEIDLAVAAIDLEPREHRLGPGRSAEELRGAEPRGERDRL